MSSAKDGSLSFILNGMGHVWPMGGKREKVQSNGMLGGRAGMGARERVGDRMQTDGQIDTIDSYQCRCLVALKFKLLFDGRLF